MIDFEFTINMPWQTFFESLGTLPLNVDCQRRYTTLFKVILPSVTYALPIWWCGTNKNEFNSLESMHCMAARVIYNLPHDMPSEDVRKTANWDSLFDTYKVKIATTPKGQRSPSPSETWTLVKSHRKWAVPKLTGISPCIDHIHVFYRTYSIFYWLHSVLIILIIYFY